MKVRCSGHFGHASPAGQEVATKNQKTKKAKHQEPKNKSQTKLKEGNSQPSRYLGVLVVRLNAREELKRRSRKGTWWASVAELGGQNHKVHKGHKGCRKSWERDPSHALLTFFVPFVVFVVNLPPALDINV
jgi:hypothetical protein